MLYSAKSEAAASWLSYTVNPLNQRRVYATSVDARGRICCWTAAPSVQSDGRTPQPVSSAGSKLLVCVVVPKARFEITPQTSPPLVRRSCAAPSRRSQSGLKLLLESVHARVTPHGANGPTVQRIRSVGFALAQLLEIPMPSRYSPALNLKAVLPLPNTSYATPILGVMSL